MKRKKNVSDSELMNSIFISLDFNCKALDYIENVLNKAKDNFNYDPDDKDYKEVVQVLEYIKFSLNYLDKEYNETLKRVGGKVDFNK